MNLHNIDKNFEKKVCPETLSFAPNISESTFAVQWHKPLATIFSPLIHNEEFNLAGHSETAQFKKLRKGSFIPEIKIPDSSNLFYNQELPSDEDKENWEVDTDTEAKKCHIKIHPAEEYIAYELIDGAVTFTYRRIRTCFYSEPSYSFSFRQVKRRTPLSNRSKMWRK